MDPIRRIVGDQPGAHYHAVEVRTCKDILEGGFNGLLSEKLMMVFDEAYWAANPQDKGKMRALVTCDSSNIRLMHTDAFSQKSFLRSYFMSNDLQLVPYDSTDERRYKCFDLAVLHLAAIPARRVLKKTRNIFTLSGTSSLTAHTTTRVRFGTGTPSSRPGVEFIGCSVLPESRSSESDNCRSSTSSQSLTPTQDNVQFRSVHK